MKKIIVSLVSLLPGLLWAEANVQTQSDQPSYLLEAPGTVSSMGTPKQGAKPDFISAPQVFVNPAHTPSRAGGYRFPQYGQQRARVNPWAEMVRPQNAPRNQAGPGLYSAPVEQQRRAFQNPWDMSNLPDFGSGRSYPGSLASPQSEYADSGYRLPPVGLGRSYAMPGSGSRSGSFSQPFPYADLPYMNDMLPGLGKDNSSFPFMPFDLF